MKIVILPEKDEIKLPPLPFDDESMGNASLRISMNSIIKRERH